LPGVSVTRIVKSDADGHEKPSGQVTPLATVMVLGVTGRVRGGVTDDLLMQQAAAAAVQCFCWSLRFDAALSPRSTCWPAFIGLLAIIRSKAQAVLARVLLDFILQTRRHETVGIHRCVRCGKIYRKGQTERQCHGHNHNCKFGKRFGLLLNTSVHAPGGISGIQEC
jgi:hypothetical protein